MKRKCWKEKKIIAFPATMGVKKYEKEDGGGKYSSLNIFMTHKKRSKKELNENVSSHAVMP